MIKIAPSTNPEREEDLINYVKTLEQTDADFLHCDVMDGNFVENKCLSAKKLYEVSENSTIALDVHLMVSNPIQVWKEYYKSKPTIITVHYESFKNKTNLFYLLNEIKKKKIMAGISVKPNTSISEIERFLPLCDLVLVMSVEPGLSGQKFIDGTLTKIEYLKKVITEKQYNIKIEVDGGINEENVAKVYKAGADIVVMGNAVYNQKNRALFIKNIKNITK